MTYAYARLSGRQVLAPAFPYPHDNRSILRHPQAAGKKKTGIDRAPDLLQVFVASLKVSLSLSNILDLQPLQASLSWGSVAERRMGTLVVIKLPPLFD